MIVYITAIRLHSSNYLNRWNLCLLSLLFYNAHESESEVAQSCPTLCDPMNCNLSGSSIHGIFQARVLEWIAIWQRPKEESRAMGQKEALSLNDHIKGAQLGMPARNFDKSKKLTFTANLLWFCIYLLQDLMSAPKYTESEKVSCTAPPSTFTKLCYMLEFPLLTMVCHI